MELFMNLLIFIITLIIFITFFRHEGKWTTAYLKWFFQFFTVISNVFCALAALGIVIWPQSQLSWTLKYLGTVSLTVTMLTVFLFLAPTTGSLKALLSGRELFMHLVTPLLAIISFLVFERRKIDISTALLGVIPVAVYGCLYWYKVVYRKQWEDFYGFNKGGRWYLYMPVMFMAVAVLCLVYKVLS
ncbi:MAG: hypothetical protein IJS38_01435 [Erysipelotrichaceae bacterium]|nr:hypothetical protein [Erysipelotrichaceae bacterium]